MAQLTKLSGTYGRMWCFRGPPVFLGTPGQFVCPLCRQTLPSHQALAAHTHRKHSVVNSLTLYTAGTVCLWCNVDHHSTDRLKYHLRQSQVCLHGLRVTVGPCYTYGTGTKRTGARGHRGLPAVRLHGPLNATPIQRQAAAEGRTASAQELSDELHQVAGVRNPYLWHQREDVISSADHPHPTPTAEAPFVLPPRLQTAAATGSGLCFWKFVDASDAGARARPSPFWAGLSRGPVCWGLPRAWHRWWDLWLAADDVTNPWDVRARRVQAPLRPGKSCSIAEHCPSLRHLAANTVAFRRVCQQASSDGMIWMYGVPSTAGRTLLRRLLPHAHFRVLHLSDGVVFTAASSQIVAQVGIATLLSATNAGSTDTTCTGLALQPSLCTGLGRRTPFHKVVRFRSLLFALFPVCSQRADFSGYA